MRIILPSRRDILSIQEEETAYYWTACVEGVLRKHGLIDLDSDGGPPEAFAVVGRRSAPVDLAAVAAGIVEGPQSPEQLAPLGIRVEPFSCETLSLYDGGRRIVGRLSYPTLRVRRIPRDRTERSDPYLHRSVDPFWGNRTIRCQELQAGSDWQPVGFAQVDDTGRLIPVALSDTRRLVLGVPLFDLASFAHAFPPLEAGYYDRQESLAVFAVETWLVDQVEAHARQAGLPTLRASAWPMGFRSALTVRYDFDRPISNADLKSILAFYQDLDLKATWGILVGNGKRRRTRRIAGRGHEIALHSVARTAEQFQDELRALARLAGSAPLGSTAHGGEGAPGYLGDTSFAWHEQAGLLYGELLGSQNVLPHAVHRAHDGAPAVGALILPACHNSLDTGTAPDAHCLDVARRQIARILRLGGHGVLMSHPDIHFDELRKLLASLDLSDTWGATFADVAEWCKLLKYDSRVHHTPHGPEVRFPEPLPRSATFELTLPTGERRQFVCRTGLTHVAVEVDE